MIFLEGIMSLYNKNETIKYAVDKISERENNWTFDDIISALGFIAAPIKTPINGFSIDSRTISNSQVFVAIKGKNFDGHDFIEEAFKNGAALCIVQREDSPALKGKSYLCVEDTKEALKKIASYARDRAVATIVAVSGSVGKTTVRTWTESILRNFGKTLGTKKNFNGEIGLPLSLVRLDENTKFGVFEVGIDSKGSMKKLSAICKPNVAILTRVSKAHIGNFASLEELAREKALLFSGLCEGGVAVIDSTCHETFDIVKKIAEEFKQKNSFSEIVTVGFADENGNSQDNAYIIDIEENVYDQETSIKARLGNKEVTYKINALGQHMALNSLLAIVSAVCSLYDKSFSDIIDENWEQYSESLLNTVKKFETLPGRGKINYLKVKERNITLIDDSYNANLSSMKAGLSVLTSFKESNRRVAIIGDMLELGESEANDQKEVFDFINESNIDQVFAIGKTIGKYYEKLNDDKKGGCAEDVSEILETIFEDLEDDDVILVKASNSVGLNKIVDHFFSFAQENISNRKSA